MGGIETLVKCLAEGMTEYRNIVVCFSTEGKDTKEMVEGVTVYRVKVNFSVMSQDVAFGYSKTLKSLMEEYQPHYVHIHCPNPFLYPLVLRYIRPETQLILHWHSDILSKGLVYLLVKPFESAILKRSNLIISTSPNYIHPSSPIYLYKDKISVVQCGMNTKDFQKLDGDDERIAEIKARYGNKKLIFFLGRHCPYKSIDWLMAIEKLVKGDCHIVIGGSGPLTESLKEANTSSRITFTGKLSAEDLRCHFFAADIFAFTSNTKAEAFGIALVEAMYCYCTPVVFHLEGSGVNWVSLKDVTGIEVPLGHLKEYANAVDRLLEDQDLRLRFAEAAHQRALNMFTNEEVVKQMSKVYKELEERHEKPIH